jgi:hypothetical protein
VWFVRDHVVPALSGGDGKSLAEAFAFGGGTLDLEGCPRTVANVGLGSDHYLRFVQFAADHPGVWAGLTGRRVALMIGKDKVDAIRAAAGLSPKAIAEVVRSIGKPPAIFLILNNMMPSEDGIGATIGLVEELRRMGVLQVDGRGSKDQSVFHLLVDRLSQIRKRHLASSGRQRDVRNSELCSLVSALLGPTPSSHAKDVSAPDLEGRSSVVHAVTSGNILLALLLCRALVANDAEGRERRMARAAKLICSPGPLSKSVVELSPSGQVLLTVGDGVRLDLGAAGQRLLTVDPPMEERNVLEWLRKLEVQAAVEESLRAHFRQANFAVTFDDFISLLDHLGQSR